MKYPVVRYQKPQDVCDSIASKVGRQDSCHKRPGYWKIGHKRKRQRNDINCCGIGRGWEQRMMADPRSVVLNLPDTVTPYYSSSLVATPRHKIISLLLRNRNLVILMKCNISLWYVTTSRGCEPQIESRCSRSWTNPANYSVRTFWKQDGLPRPLHLKSTVELRQLELADSNLVSLYCTKFV